MNGVGVELAGNARLGLVLAEAEHADAGNQHYGGAGIADGRRVGGGEGLIVGAVLLAIFVEGRLDLRLQGIEAGIRGPRHKQGPDLCTNKVIGATGAQKSELFGVGGPPISGGESGENGLKTQVLSY